MSQHFGGASLYYKEVVNDLTKMTADLETFQRKFSVFHGDCSSDIKAQVAYKQAVATGRLSSIRSDAWLWVPRLFVPLGPFAAFPIASMGGALISCLYPFLNAAFFHSNHNALQSFCFVGVCICIGMAIPMVPYVYRFIYTSVALTSLIQTTGTSKELLLSWITDYHVPTPTQIYDAVIPNKLVPYDLRMLMGEFVAHDAIDVGTLTLADCGKFRAKTA